MMSGKILGFQPCDLKGGTNFVSVSRAALLRAVRGLAEKKASQPNEGGASVNTREVCVNWAWVRSTCLACLQ